MKDVIFISWQKHQRTRSFCEKLGIPLLEITTQKSGLARYREVIARTFAILREYKPKKLIIQNPSIVLTTLAVVLKPFVRYQLVVDAHNEAVIPQNYNNYIIRLLARFLIRYSNATIVTNDVLANTVNSYGGKALVLPDFLPNVDVRPFLLAPKDDERYELTLISTYANDEPYQEVFAALQKLGNKFRLKVTGKIPAHIDRHLLPSNVELLGFISHQEYWEQLYRSHVVIDLTTMDNCLVCGAYESMAIEKPLLLSANPASLSLFGDYATHVENESNAIAQGITDLVSNYSQIAEKMVIAKSHFLTLEEKNISEIKKLLH
jgi:glycosyltransferase involved in cell wall biosynthesis